MKNRIRIILADDHSEAADGEELLILLEKTAVDVVVVD